MVSQAALEALLASAHRFTITAEDVVGRDPRTFTEVRRPCRDPVDACHVDRAVAPWVGACRGRWEIPSQSRKACRGR